MAEEKLRGRGVIPGIAIGRLMLVNQNLAGYLATYQAGDVETETLRLNEALSDVVATLMQNVKALREKNMPEQSAIMEAHRMMAQDPMLAESAASKIKEGTNAAYAILNASEESAQIFENMDDAYFRERAVDIRDVGKRIAKRILGVKDPELVDNSVILCGTEIEPSVIASLPTEKIKGVILGRGSTTCHAVIIAKARAIATVVGLGDKLEGLIDGSPVVLDGETGEIIFNPSAQNMNLYKAKYAEQEKLKRHYAELIEQPAETRDGVRVQLMANISAHRDVSSAVVDYGAEGIGLFRTEFVFMERDHIPREEEQFRTYKEVVEKANGNLCVFRTMDIGGDKPLAYLDVPPEDNPFLGWRAIRISLQRHDLFMPQLKAILRAGVYGKAAIMLPMVISLSEIEQTKQLIEEAKIELTHEGKAYSDNVPLGIMVETPAAAVMTPVLAKHVDFFSIGTNDLVQYTLAVDRVNHNVSYLYNHFHPAVLRLIQLTVQSAKENGIWSGMCGEMASDPMAAVLLLGMGMDELSMSAPSIPKVKEKIRSITAAEAKQLLAEVMEMEDGDTVREYLNSKM